MAPLTADADPRLAAVAAACLPWVRAADRTAGALTPRTFRAPGPPVPPVPSARPALSAPPSAIGVLPPRPSVPRCQRAAARRVAATAFEPLWHAWSRMPVHLRRRAGTAALRLDPTTRARLRSAADAHHGEVRAHANAILHMVDTDSVAFAPPAPPVISASTPPAASAVPPLQGAAW